MHQLSVHYISKALLPTETHYPDMEMFVLSLIMTSRKPRPYFQAHSIYVLTSFSLKHVLQNREFTHFSICLGCQESLQSLGLDHQPLYSKKIRLQGLFFAKSFAIGTKETKFTI